MTTGGFATGTGSVQMEGRLAGSSGNLVIDAQEHTLGTDRTVIVRARDGETPTVSGILLFTTTTAPSSPSSRTTERRRAFRCSMTPSARTWRGRDHERRWPAQWLDVDIRKFHED